MSNKDDSEVSIDTPPMYRFKPAISSLEEACELLQIAPDMPWETIEAQRQQRVRATRPLHWATLDTYQQETLQMQARLFNLAYAILIEQCLCVAAQAPS